MKLLKISAILLVLFILSCSTNKNTKPLFMASSFPVYAILSELTAGIADVEYLVPSGASPHTYTPKPSDVKKSTNSVALFYIADNFDGWISDIPSKNVIKLIDFVHPNDLIYFDDDSGHSHSHSSEQNSHNHSSIEIDPHFWLNPVLVKNMISKLSDKLIELYPSSKEKLIENSINFQSKLDSLDNNLKAILSVVEGKTVFLHHPSFNYLLSRYGLKYGGAIEEIPGKEPSPKFLAQLIDKIQTTDTKAIFSEPQLNLKTAQIIADECKVKLCELNPEGSIEDTRTYYDLLIYNATIIRNCLE